MDAEILDEIRKLRGQIIQLENRMDFLFKTFNIEYVDITTETGMDPRLIGAIKKGNMIEAIKIYENLTQCGLVEAKTAVETMWAKYSS